jgi:hypothetical protein
MPEMSVAAPIEVIVVNDDAFWRTDDAVFLGKKITGEGFSVGVNQSSATVETESLFGFKRTVGLEVIELFRFKPLDEERPNMSPSVFFAIELDDFRRLHVGNFVIQQQFHGLCQPTDNDEPHPIIVQNCTTGQRIGKSHSGRRNNHVRLFKEGFVSRLNYVILAVRVPDTAE